MPTFVPRAEPVKKREELSKREYELLQALGKNLLGEQLRSAVEKYRKARLSLLKAQIHVVKEKEYQNRSSSYRLEKITAAMEAWKNKTVENIIDEFRSQHKIG